MFDQTRLSVGRSVGEPIGLNGALCSVNVNGRVRVLVFSDDGKPLSRERREGCRIPVRIVERAAPGAVALLADELICAAPGALPECAYIPGRIDVGGEPIGGLPALANHEPVIGVMLKAGADGISPESLAAFDFSSATHPPIDSLNEPRPLRVTMMMLPRAKGDFAEMLRRNPATNRAKLERYVRVHYRTFEELDRALAALQRDPVVEHATRPIQSFATNERTAPSGPIDDSPTLQTKDQSNQPHLAMHRLPQAWHRAGGWSLIGIADSGLAPQHPGLAPFDASGLYLGGNFLPVFSADIGTAGQFFLAMRMKNVRSTPTRARNVRDHLRTARPVASAVSRAGFAWSRVSSATARMLPGWLPRIRQAPDKQLQGRVHTAG